MVDASTKHRGWLGLARPFAFGALMSAAAACGGSGSSESPAPSGATLQPDAAGQIDAGAQPNATAGTEAPQAPRENRPALPPAPGLLRIADGAIPVRESLVDPVGFEHLMATLPEVDGWTRSHHRGEQHTVPVRYAAAEARYERAGERVQLEVIDTGRSRLLVAPYAMFLSTGFEERSSEGYTRAVTFHGSPAFEDWRSASRRAELVVVVEDRFLIKGTGANVSDLEAVRQVLGRVDVAGLSARR